MTPVSTLLAALREFLRTDLRPQLSGYSQYQTRVAENLLALLERERRFGERLRSLDADFAATHGLDPQDMPAAASRALRDGALQDDSSLRDYLRRRGLLAQAIDNPRYSAFAQALERWSRLAKELDLSQHAQQPQKRQ